MTNFVLGIWINSELNDSKNYEKWYEFKEKTAEDIDLQRF